VERGEVGVARVSSSARYRGANRPVLVRSRAGAKVALLLYVYRVGVYNKRPNSPREAPPIWERAMERRIFDDLSDVGRSANLVGLALMSVSAAGAFLQRRWIRKSDAGQRSQTDKSVVDMPKSQNL
jgi:hypothetical protein